MRRIHCQKCEAFLTVDQTHIDDGLCDMCWPYRDVPRLHKEQMEGDKRYCTVCGDGDLEEYYIFPDCNPGMDYFCNDHEPKNMTFMDVIRFNYLSTYPKYDPNTVPTTIVRIDKWTILIPTFQQMCDYSEELAYWTTRD